jgi:hypothetical protein
MLRNRCAALFGVFALVAVPACGDRSAAVETDAKGKAAQNQADAKRADGAGKIGVPECDEFLEKYERCINEKVPEAGKAGAKAAMDALVKSFKDSAAGPGRDQLASTCKSSTDTTKQSMAAMGCSW